MLLFFFLALSESSFFWCADLSSHGLILVLAGTCKLGGVCDSILFCLAAFRKLILTCDLLCCASIMAFVYLYAAKECNKLL
eukprot:m.876259 g.876259  ORF g.876259 m.876259 type:complete len:81 (+) comp59820_c0_seq2:5460-5702(+)